MLGKGKDYTGPADGVVEAEGAIGIPRDTREYEKNIGHHQVTEGAHLPLSYFCQTASSGVGGSLFTHQYLTLFPICPRDFF